MPITRDTVNKCACGRQTFILASRRRLHDLGLMPMRCYGCKRLLPPQLPEITSIVKVQHDPAIAAAIKEEINGLDIAIRGNNQQPI